MSYGLLNRGDQFKMTNHNSFSLATFVFIFNKDMKKILLIKRNRGKRFRWGFDWGIIGGKVESGECSAEAAIREVKEETSIELSKELLFLIKYQERPSKIHTPAVHFFYVTTVDENLEIKINKESDEYFWHDIKNLPKSMIETPKDIREAFNFATKITKKFLKVVTRSNFHFH